MEYHSRGFQPGAARAAQIGAWLDEAGAPSEIEALAWAAREHGDGIAGQQADELARRGEWEL